MLKTEFLDAFTSENEWLTTEELMRRTGETVPARIWDKSMHCQERGLIKSANHEGSVTNGRVYAITRKGVIERGRFNEINLDVDREEPAVDGMNFFYAGHYRRLASWKAILNAILGKGWVTAGSITAAAIDFYKPHSARKALREMVRDGLVEVNKSAIHRKVKLYRTTPEALEFVRCYHD